MTAPNGDRRPRLVEVDLKSKTAPGSRRPAITLYLAVLLWVIGACAAIELGTVRWFIYGWVAAILVIFSIVIPGRGES